MRRLIVLGLLMGCGRLGFESRSLEGSDAATDGAGDGPIGDGPVTPDGPSNARPNRIFATKAVMSGAIGGLAAADAICANEAADASLDGTFIAVLSTSTVNAIDRLAGFRGWVRVDDTPVTDSFEGLFNGQMFSPITLDAGGGLSADVTAVWTGTGIVGQADATCEDWTMGLGASGRTGFALASPPVALTGGVDGCAADHHLYCAEIGFEKAVGPVEFDGRIAFLSTSILGTAGVPAFDARCQADAESAGLAGTFLAAVATKTASAASRFTLDGTPWARIDGTRLTSDGNGLFDGTSMKSFLHQRANGSYVQQTNFWSGSIDPNASGDVSSTCNDWASTNGPATVGLTGRIRSSELWGDVAVGNTLACEESRPVLCLQQ